MMTAAPSTKSLRSKSNGAQSCQPAFASERKRWWRNLRGGAEVEIRLRGRRRRGQAEVVKDSAAVATYVDRYPRARTAIEVADPPTFVRVAALTPNS
jgi:hypothetical protein